MKIREEDEAEAVAAKLYGADEDPEEEEDTSEKQEQKQEQKDSEPDENPDAELVGLLRESGLLGSLREFLRRAKRKG